MIALITTIHILTAVVLVLSVLLQSAKGSDVAGAFGGMGSQAAFGPRGTATFLSKATIVMAAVFVITSVSLVRMGSDSPGGGDSVLSDEPVTAAPAVPVTPLPTATGTPAPSATVSTVTNAPPGVAGILPQVKVESITAEPAVPPSSPPAASPAAPPAAPSATPPSAPAPPAGQ